MLGATTRQVDLTQPRSGRGERSDAPPETAASSSADDPHDETTVLVGVLVAGVVTATAVAAVIGAAMLIDVVPAPAGLAVVALLPAAVIDLRERRLPDLWVGSAAAVFLAATMTAWIGGESPAVGHAGLGVLLTAGPILTLHLVSPASMGFGDVKAAAVLGLAVGSVDWRLAIVALTLAAGAAGATGIVARVRTIAFGPFLVLGAATALVASDRWLAPMLDGKVTS